MYTKSRSRHFLRAEHRIRLLLVLILLSVSAYAQDDITPTTNASVDAMEQVDFATNQAPNELLQTPIGSRVKINNVKMGYDQPDPNVVIELERFRVFSKNAKIQVHGDDAVETLEPQATAYFRGKVANEEQSMVFLAVDPSGETRTIIHRNGDIFVNNKTPSSVSSLSNAEFSRQVDKIGDFAHRRFECGVDNLQQPQGQLGDILKEARHIKKPTTSGVDTTTYEAQLIIETDYEYYNLFPSTAAASQYMSDLFAYISSVYQNEINVKLKIAQLNLYSSSNDPWTATGGTSAALGELRTYYHENHRQVERTVVHFISGKNLGGGIAYVYALCYNASHESYFNNNAAWDMGVSANIAGSFDPNNPQVVWDGVVVAHELGHNFGSFHTHDYDVDYDAYSQPIDCCYDSQSGGVCSSRTPAFPGENSLSGGSAGQGAGTIMSYCHVSSPGISNISMTLGKNHIYGIDAFRVADVTRQLTETRAASYPRCFATVVDEKAVMNDHNGDGKSDILWRNQTSGKNVMYLMDGRQITSSGTVNTISNTDWQIVGTGDYNGDGKSDVLWRNQTTGKNHMYYMDGRKITASKSVNTVSNTDWRVVGNGDYNGDGKSDILWRNQTTGKNHMYYMDGRKIASSKSVNIVSNLDWEVVGSGDYDGDGKSDILWRNQTTGKNVIYLMDGKNIVSSGVLNTVSNTDWRVVGGGDYNGDGKSDILWRNQSTGENVMYLLDGRKIISSGTVNTVSNMDWRVVGSGDYNGDGKSDILWRNQSTGENMLYHMDARKIVSSGTINTISNQDWAVVNVF